MGRPPTPTNALKLHGGFREDRHAERANEPRPEGALIEFVPLDGEALRAWEFLLPRVEQMGLSSEVYSLEFVAVCQWWAEFQKYAQDTVIAATKRTAGMKAAYKEFRAGARLFGLNPTDIVNVCSGLPTAQDEIADLIA